MLLDRVKIGYKNYDIEITAPTSVLYIQGEECYGQIIHTENKIFINKDFDEDQQHATLLHEIIHGISNVYDISLSESKVTKLSSALYTVLKDNNLKIVKTE